MNKSYKTAHDSFNEVLLYTTPNGKVKVEMYLHDENIWLTQQKIADLFGVDRSVVSKHLKNVFSTLELKEDSVCAKIAHTANDGKTYSTQFYNLDAIISVGYRVSSTQDGVVMYMKDWVEKLNAFLKFNDKEVLSHQGVVSHEVAVALAEKEYEKFQIVHNKLLESDFDKVIKLYF